ncbi:MAG: aminoacyl-tRNA hydrolase [Candidatus Lariskella arthropodorum]
MFDLVVGLGNPGSGYATTRHNIGFMIVDALHNEYGVQGWKEKFNSEIAKITVEDKHFMLAKPMAYMNNSGDAVAAIMRFYKIAISRVLVIHDDLDLDFARIKFKVGGGSGGHNGIKSIDKICGNKYGRLRFGVSKPSYADASSHVLSGFSAEEVYILSQSVENIVRNIDFLLSGRSDSFMNLYVAKKFGVDLK